MSRGSQRDSPATVGLLCQTENVVNRKLLGSSRHKPKVAFPITVSVVDPVLPLDAKALHDIINVRSRMHVFYLLNFDGFASSGNFFLKENERACAVYEHGWCLWHT